jgi:short-subunit dehydrogenase
MRIRDRVVLITGASEGIGAACVEVLRRRGALVSLVARSKAKLQAIGGPDSLITAGDLREADVRHVAVERTIAHFGRIDILINNAGVGVYEPANTMPMEHVRAMWELNFFAPLELAQLAIRDMKTRGEGMIVNVSSIAGKVTLPWFTMYSASKYALNSLTEGLRMELKGSGIHTIAVCPGYVRTRFQQNVIAGTPPPLEGLRARWAITAEKVAQEIVRGIERDARTVLTPRSGWLCVAGARLFPRLIESRLAAIYGRLGIEA